MLVLFVVIGILCTIGTAAATLAVDTESDWGGAFLAIVSATAYGSAAYYLTQAIKPVALEIVL